MNAKLKEIFGDINYSEEDIEKIVYSRDASKQDGFAYGVVFPTNIQQVHDLVRHANRQNLPLVIRGGGTSKVGGCVPQKALVVDMSKMNKILELTNDYIVIQAGVKLDNLNFREKEFPIKPIDKEARTMGGIIATNALDFKNINKNRISDWLLEVEMIDGNGKHLRMKRDILKNVCGQEGLSGIIVQAKIKIKDKDKTTVKIMKFPLISRLIKELDQLLVKPNIVAIEYIGEHCSELLELGEGSHLIVEYSDAEGNIDEDVNVVWNMRKKLPFHLAINRYYDILDVQIPLNKVGQFLHWIRKNQVPCYGHIAKGIFYLSFKKDSKQIPEVKQFVKIMNGKIGVEFGIGLKNKQELTEEEKSRLQILKAQYDSKNIMNRGKVID
ncbi:MAG: FAD-binding oxidoreductase [archaeon]